MAFDTGWIKQALNPTRAGSGPPTAQGEQVAVYLSGSVVATVKATVGERFAATMRADPLVSLTDLGGRLVEQVKGLDLSRSAARRRCNLVLAPELYHLSMVERPDVADDDVADAVRWRLQDQVDYPVENASVDVFPLPDSASRDRKMVFAVCMQTEFLRGLVAEIYAAGLELASIDITELSLRNLAWHCFPHADQSVAWLRLTANSGIINVSRGDELYLARRVSGVPKSFSEPTWEDFRERMLLQVQRSIDYYESAMNQPHCNMLMVACTDDWTERVTEYLSDMLPIPTRSVGEAMVGEMELRLHNPDPQPVDWAHLTSPQTNAIAAALPAFGGVLRNVIGSQREQAA